MKEQILEKEIETFTKDEAEEIAKENIGLIHHIIGTLNCTNFDYTELYDAGLFGYAKAINSFNKNKEILFSFGSSVSTGSFVETELGSFLVTSLSFLFVRI